MDDIIKKVAEKYGIFPAVKTGDSPDKAFEERRKEGLKEKDQLLRDYEKHIRILEREPKLTLLHGLQKLQDKAFAETMKELKEMYADEPALTKEQQKNLKLGDTITNSKGERVKLSSEDKELINEMEANATKAADRLSKAAQVAIGKLKKDGKPITDSKIIEAIEQEIMDRLDNSRKEPPPSGKFPPLKPKPKRDPNEIDI